MVPRGPLGFGAVVIVGVGDKGAMDGAVKEGEVVAGAATGVAKGALVIVIVSMLKVIGCFIVFVGTVDDVIDGVV